MNLNPLTLIETDVFSVLTLIVILYVLGTYMGSDGIRFTSRVLFMGAFLAYCAYRIDSWDAYQWVEVCLRGLLAGAFVYVVATIVLSALAIR